MFTGLIEQVGIVKNIQSKAEGKIFEIIATFSKELKIGESVAINGACQSVIKIKDDTFCVFCMKESLNRTNLDLIKVGEYVNLERALILGQRLDGHIVQGHIDSTAKFLNSKKQGDSEIFEFEYDTKYIVDKGSITINGISLTICKVNKNSFCISVIPQTLERTNLKYLKYGDFVNIEIDIFAKYIEKFLSANHNKEKRISLEFLRENGF